MSVFGLFLMHFIIHYYLKVMLSNRLCLCASVSVRVDRVAIVQPHSLHGRDAARVTVWRSHL